jgi:hypothetical protein
MFEQTVGDSLLRVIEFGLAKPPSNDNAASVA